MPDGEVPAPGSIFTNVTLAETYLRVLREAESAGGDRVAQIERARKTWSQGFVARGDRQVLPHAGRHGHLAASATAACSPAATWRHGRPRSRRRSHYDYGRYRVMKAGPWSQGLATLQTLALLKGYDLDRLSPVSADFIHLQIEATKLAFADRDTFYGDPKFVKVPIDVLLSDAYNAERRKLITDRASLEQRPGTIPGFGKRLELRLAAGARAAVSSAGAGEPTVGRIWTHDEDHLPDVAGRARATCRRDAGRHRAFRHHRPRRQHGVVDAVGRLAAFLAGHSRARLLPRHPRAAVLARRGASGRADARKAPALDADADHGAARRRALPRLGLAGRRPAGPVDRRRCSCATSTPT